MRRRLPPTTSLDGEEAWAMFKQELERGLVVKKHPRSGNPADRTWLPAMLPPCASPPHPSPNTCTRTPVALPFFIPPLDACTPRERWRRAWSHARSPICFRSLPVLTHTRLVPPSASHSFPLAPLYFHMSAPLLAGVMWLSQGQICFGKLAKFHPYVLKRGGLMRGGDGPPAAL